VYDVNKSESFENVEFWLNQILENNEREDIVLYLVGNKVDLTEISGSR
jgi:GTPase SAR1 family protein